MPLQEIRAVKLDEDQICDAIRDHLEGLAYEVTQIQLETSQHRDGKPPHITATAFLADEKE